MATLREYLNAQIKSKGSSLSAEKAKASKYKSIAAAKKAGALYYTDKNGKVMAAVYASDLSKPLSTSLRPKARPESKITKTASQPKVRTSMLDSPKMFAPSRSPVDQLVKDTKKAIKPSASARREEALRKAVENPGNAAAKKALEKFGPLTAVERAKIRAAEKKKNK
jgi:hypothetical protein